MFKKHKSQKLEQEEFLKDLQKFHKNMGWKNLPRKTKCVECKTYHHEVSKNVNDYGYKLCHACNNVKQQVLEQLGNR